MTASTQAVKQPRVNGRFVKAAQQETAVSAEFKVDVSRGQVDGTVSSQWSSRPDDQKFLSLETLEKHCRARSLKMVDEVVDVNKLRVIPHGNNGMRVIHGDLSLQPTHFTFSSLAGKVGARASYLQTLPSSLAAQCLEHGLRASADDDQTKLYHNGSQLMAATSPTYGRIFDADLVAAVRKVAGNGTGDTRWKVPGMINWQKGTYNPFVDITKDTTTLYASDRDVFMFLVDDTHPIEVGKLANGDPDLMFRGIYLWNSEVGARSLGISTFLLRGVCQNRNLWGVEDQLTLSIRHTKLAPDRFVEDFNKTLIEYSKTDVSTPVIMKVKAAKEAILAKTADQRLKVLQDLGLTRAQAIATVTRVVEEEGHDPVSVWDFVQGLTAQARTVGTTDNRKWYEHQATKLMDRVTA